MTKWQENSLEKLNIIAIGGGEIRQGQTRPIDEIAVAATKKHSPLALFVPTASNDSDAYWQVFQRLYGRNLGCRTEVLFLIRETPSVEEIAVKIDSADLIYVGGGNTRMMLEVWRQLAVDKMLKSAANRGTVLCGLSAGALCWFKYGNSDAPSLEGAAGPKTMRIQGLGLIDAAMCPHIISETFRMSEFEEMMRTTPGVGLGLDNGCAIQVRGSQYRILTARPDAYACKLYRQKGLLKKCYLRPSRNFFPLPLLLNVGEPA